MLVMSPTVGRAISASLLISPGMFVPISRTTMSWEGPRFKRDRGSPTKLLRVPRLLRTRYRSSKRKAIISLVLVFPFVPVIPITGTENLSLQNLAMSPKARRVSGTAIMGWDADVPTEPPSRYPFCPITPAAPLAKASPTKA